VYPEVFGLLNGGESRWGLTVEVGEDDLGGGKSKVDQGHRRTKLLGSSLGRHNLRCGRISLPVERTEPETYAIDDTIRVPILLRDEDGVAHVRAIFRRMRRPGNLGPRGLDPDDTVELRGNGGGQKQATVETTLEVRDEHEPGDYLCVAIQAYDSEGNMVMIKNPKPTKVFRIVDLGSKDDHKVEFLGWGEG
jgi:hypothetical protein